MMASFLSKFKTMKVSLLVLSMEGPALNPRGGDNRKLRDKALIFFKRLRQKEHIADEHAVPGLFGHHSDRQAIIFICSGIDVLDKNIMPLQVTEQAIVKGLKFFSGKRTVIGTPPNIIF